MAPAVFPQYSCSLWVPFISDHGSITDCLRESDESIRASADCTKHSTCPTLETQIMEYCCKTLSPYPDTDAYHCGSGRDDEIQSVHLAEALRYRRKFMMVMRKSVEEILLADKGYQG